MMEEKEDWDIYPNWLIILTLPLWIWIVPFFLLWYRRNPLGYKRTKGVEVDE